MNTAGDSLPPAARPVREQGDGLRLWALAISVVMHGGLLYLSSGWLARVARRAPERAFVVNLVALPSDPGQTAAPQAPQPEPAEPETRDSPAEREAAGRPAPGRTEAPRLPPDASASAVHVAVHGDSAAVSERAPAEPGDRVDALSERLFERMDEIAPPRSLGEAERSEVVSTSPARQLGSAAGIVGDVGRRGLLYMEQPPYAEWGRRAGVEAEVRFRFWVSADGSVVRILAIRKSAHPEFETQARQALARWRFEPLPPGQDHEEWGEVPFKYELRGPTGG